jgi:hypothetical protein
MRCPGPRAVNGEMAVASRNSLEERPETAYSVLGKYHARNLNG